MLAKNGFNAVGITPRTKHSQGALTKQLIQLAGRRLPE